MEPHIRSSGNVTVVTTQKVVTFAGFRIHSSRKSANKRILLSLNLCVTIRPNPATAALPWFPDLLRVYRFSNDCFPVCETVRQEAGERQQSLVSTQPPARSQR